jgi:hypothetical protein
MKRLFWVLLLALSACATMHGGGGEDRYWLKPEASSNISDGSSLLQYAGYVRNLGTSERDREVERQRTAYARDKSDFRRLQYALVLAMPDANASERRSAQQLIEPLLEGKHDPELMALASLLSTQLSAQAAAAAANNTQLQTLKRAEELEKKLDAVKDIERSLLRREKGKL